MSVGGRYYEGTADHLLLVTVPGARSSIRGSGGLVATGHVGSFKFTASYASNGILQGSVVYTERNASGDMTLRSTSLLGLVVMGQRAYLLGYATLNGTDGYTFLVSMRDNTRQAKPDLFGMLVTTSSSALDDDCSFAPVTINLGHTVVVRK
jgi:hypothetical protein